MTASAASPSATATRSTLQSNKQKSLNRFFPEVATGLARLKADRFERGTRRSSHVHCVPPNDVQYRDI